MFLSFEGVRLDSLQFVKNSSQLLKRIQYSLVLLILVPFIGFTLPNWVLIIGESLNKCGLYFVYYVVSFRDFCEQMVEFLIRYDGPSFLFWAFGLIWYERKFLDKTINITDQEYLCRQILLRDRMFSLMAYYLFCQQFFDHFSSILRINHIYEIAPLTAIRFWINRHFVMFSYVIVKFPYAIPFFTVVVYRFIVRRRNGYDTIWLDYLKRFEWHDKPIPPLKHVVRYNWAMAWLLEVFGAAIVEITDVSVGFFPHDQALIMHTFIIYVVYYLGSFFYIEGALCALLGLRCWCPFLHRAVSNQVGLYNPPGRFQPKSQFQADFDPTDDNNPYFKFRF